MNESMMKYNKKPYFVIFKEDGYKMHTKLPFIYIFSIASWWRFALMFFGAPSSCASLIVPEHHIRPRAQALRHRPSVQCFPLYHHRHSIDTNKALNLRAKEACQLQIKNRFQTLYYSRTIF